MFIYLYSAYACFHATIDLSSCDRDCMADKAKIFTINP